MRPTVAALCSLLALCIVGCSNVKTKKVTADNKDKLWEQIKDSHDLSVEEVQLLQGYLIRQGMKDAMAGKDASFPVGKTVGEMIDDQRRFVADQKARESDEQARREKARGEDDEKRKALLDALTVTLYEKGFATVAYQDYVTLRLSYENRSGKDIRGFKGTVVFNDLFGDKIKEVTLKEDEVLRAGETRRVSRSISYNQFIAESQKLRDTQLENMHVAWVPDLIMFNDGTSMATGAASP
jgi:hypothetical protein